MPRGGVGLFIASYLVLLWFVSSVGRGKGALIFAFGAAGMLLAMARARRHGPDAAYGLWFGLLLSGASVAAAEALLWARPSILKGRMANYVLDGYHSERDGIYQPDPWLGRGLRPLADRTMFWNGHFWRHRANVDGYRGPRVASADAVFLGDSMVYGHGVEDDQTVAAQFARLTHVRSANLGQQGTCQIQSLVLLRRRGEFLRPRIIFAASHWNDVDEAAYWYDTSELRRFIATPGYLPRAKDEFVEPAGTLLASWGSHVAVPLRVGRLAVALIKGPPSDPGGRPNPFELGVPAGPYVPGPEEIARKFEPESQDEALGWSAHQMALREMKTEADRLGAEFVVFDLGYPDAFSSAIERVAGEIGARYSAAGRIALRKALDGEDVYLRQDGHWSPHGSEIIARELARELSRPSR